MSDQTFLCPKCQKYNLVIELANDIEPDDYNDEARLQTIKCNNCDFVGIAIYQKSSRGSMDESNFTHQGYFVKPEVYDTVQNDITNKTVKNIDDYTKNSLSKFQMVLVDKPI